MKPRHIKAADLFCGAGGTSEGMLRACRDLGHTVDLTAVNHWPVAIETHLKNHSTARHLCTSVDDVNPRSLFKPGELYLLWASPECTHHSKARGGKPMSDQSRATGHCVVRWAEALLPNVILVENVPEFLDWGPLGTNGLPLKSKKGSTFKAWVGMLESLGYRVEWRILCAADYGDPTTRARLFVQCVRGRLKIVWPERTHASEKELRKMREQGDLFGKRTLKPWVPAKDIIDWELKGRWLDEMPAKAQYGGLPLSPNTLRRIYTGLEKFGLKPFVHGAGGAEYAGKPRGVDRPLTTVLCRDRRAVAEPFLISIDHTGGNGNGVSDIASPLTTCTTKQRHGVVEPFIVELRGTGKEQIKRSAKDVQQPLTAVSTSGAHHGLAEPYLVQVAHGDSGSRRVRSIEETLNTVVGSNDTALVEPFLVQVAHQGGDRASTINTPLKTVCGKRDMALIEPHLLPQQTCGVLRPVSEPSPTVATAGAIALVEPFLIEYYGNSHNGVSVEKPLPTVTTKERFALVNPQVVVNGQRFMVRLRWRMLQPHELQQAQGFPRDYKFHGTKTETVKQIGNAVPVNLAQAIVKAVLTQEAA